MRRMSMRLQFASGSSGYVWHPYLTVLLRHVRRHQQRGIEALDEISIDPLRRAFFRNREELGRMAGGIDKKSLQRWNP